MLKIEYRDNEMKAMTLLCFRNVGMLAGCLTAGQVADRINQHVLQSAALLMIGVTLSSAPWSQNCALFSFIIAVQGFFSGIHSVGE